MLEKFLRQLFCLFVVFSDISIRRLSVLFRPVIGNDGRDLCISNVVEFGDSLFTLFSQ
jgi:hypothetical protein